jgi:hypothetical protein
MSRERDKGTRWETACVALLHQIGITGAHREPLHGNVDHGDIGGLHVAIQCKATGTYDIPGALRDAKKQAIAAGKWLGCVWQKARGKAKPADGWLIFTGHDGAELLRVYEAHFGCCASRKEQAG